jgi:hypothetical protein
MMFLRVLRVGRVAMQDGTANFHLLRPSTWPPWLRQAFVAGLILGIGTALSIVVFWLLVPQSVAGDKATYKFIVARIADDTQRLLDSMLLTFLWRTRNASSMER